MLWRFKPNWQNGVIESLEWATSVLRTRDGSEQRRMLRMQPRRRFQFNFTLKQSESQSFDNFLWENQSGLIYAPVWMDKSKTIGPTSGNIIQCDTVNKSYTAGQYVLLLSQTDYEILTIQSVAPELITTTANLTKSWPTDTEVYPVYYAGIEGNVAFTRQTDYHITGSVQQLLEPVTSDAYLPDQSAPVTLDGYEYFTTRPNWAGGFAMSQNFPLETVDSITGPIERSKISDLPETIRPVRFLLKTREEIRQFREFVARRKGRLKPFLMPSWFSDLKPAAGIMSNDTRIFCENNGQADVGNIAERKHIYIRIGHVTYTREVTDVQLSGDFVEVSFVPPLGGTYAKDQILGIYFVSPFRLASDAVTIEWQTDSIATVDLQVVNVKRQS